MSTQPTVFITVPKYVAITPLQASTGSNVTTVGSTALPKIRPAPAKTPIPENVSETTASEVATQAPKGKKRRLDHLTWEEKVQRKKLKNRVAAQTSRDRKKARMEEMEHEIQELTEKTQLLDNKCESLQMINDSLMEKNQKLFIEVEQLRQQLQEVQQQKQQHQTVSCAGSGIKHKGQSVVTGDSCSVKIEAAAEKECDSVVTVAGNSSMPSLQDMLLPEIKFDERALDDAEFDAEKLEELAESLLADITADLESSDRASDAPDAEITSGAKRLFGSMVGSTTECLESSQHTENYNGSSLKPIRISIAPAATETTLVQQVSNKNSLQTPELTLENKFDKETNAAPNNSTQTLRHLNIKDIKTTALDATVSPEISTPLITTIKPETSTSISVTPDTVYGTYDAKTNSITIVMDDVAVPVSEAVEEIYCDGVAATNTSDEVVCTTGSTSPSHVYLNVSTCSDDDVDFDNEVNFNFDPIEKFLCPKRPLVSPLAKSPALSINSATSDHGYESIIGSPLPPSRHFDPLSEELSNDDYSVWPPGFNELFPSLI